jgi:hypothetical protein
MVVETANVQVFSQESVDLLIPTIYRTKMQLRASPTASLKQILNSYILASL